MKTPRYGTLLALGALAVAALVTYSALAPQPAAAVAVGSAAPGFSLADLNGKTRSLAAEKGKVVVLEWINPNCPFSQRQATDKVMQSLASKYGKVTWFGINSTNPTHRDYLEPSAHQAWAAKNGVEYTILYDPKGEIGRAYGAKTTPHMYIVDAAGKVAYNGAIDDDPSGKKAKAERRNYVDGGLTAMLAGNAIDPASTQPYGCSIKY